LPCEVIQRFQHFFYTGGTPSRPAAEEDGSRGSQLSSGHPDPGNRAQAVSNEVNTLPRKTYLANSNDFTSVKQRVAGMNLLWHSNRRSAKPKSYSASRRQRNPQRKYEGVHPQQIQDFLIRELGCFSATKLLQ